MNISKTYTIEMKESRAKLMNENKTIVFNQNDVGTSIIKFICKKSDDTKEDLTDVKARVRVKTPVLDSNEENVIATQENGITIDDSNGTITVELDKTLIENIGEHIMQLQLVSSTDTDVYTYTPQINYTVKDVIG